MYLDLHAIDDVQRVERALDLPRTLEKSFPALYQVLLHVLPLGVVAVVERAQLPQFSAEVVEYPVDPRGAKTKKPTKRHAKRRVENLIESHKVNSWWLHTRTKVIHFFHSLGRL